MRSRYSAFCRSEIDYLLQSAVHDKQISDEREQLQASCAATQWHSLRVLAHKQNGDRGEVEFIAFYSDASKPNNVQQLHELSSFTRADGRWLYTSGKFLAPIKLQRNDLCWCGSGKKLKKCHPDI